MIDDVSDCTSMAFAYSMNIQLQDVICAKYFRSSCRHVFDFTLPAAATAPRLESLT